mmetsp:Transcript_7326/g.10844  ORF Transcript_7326/g.10844 Transcript_7326/m.10844 type:complete len:222 (+) Transcript_7326:114-779(+)
MKLVLSFLTISVAAAASQDGSFIRGGSASVASDDSAASATHVIPGDIFAALASNNFTPQQYCPRGTSYNSNGPEWPAEDGCYPVSTDSFFSPLFISILRRGCPSNHNPVCGCDGETYSNECVAAAFGLTTVMHFGPCNEDQSGCNKNSDCQSNEYCDFPDGTCGGNKGRCTTIPSGEDCNGVTNAAVCGCDDVKYKNYCKANQSGTSIQNEGDCSSELAFE